MRAALTRLGRLNLPSTDALASAARWCLVASLVPSVAWAQLDPRQAAFEQALRQAAAENPSLAGQLQSVAQRMRPQIAVSASSPPAAPSTPAAPPPAAPAGAAGAGATGGGLGTTGILVGIGVAAAAGGAVALSSGGGGDSKSSTASSSTSSSSSSGGTTPPAAPPVTPPKDDVNDRTGLKPISSDTAEFRASTGLGQIKLGAALDLGLTGKGVTVAVIDTGVAAAHPDLAANIAAGSRDFTTSPTGTTTLIDNVGHGTHVSGIIAAARNGSGVQGVAPDAKILALRVGDATLTGFIREAVDYAVAQGARAINGSYGLNLSSALNLSLTSSARLITEFDAYKRATNAGVVMVFATGNFTRSNPSLPALLPYIQPANDAEALSLGLYRNRPVGMDYSATQSRLLAVAAVDGSNTIASFSNRCGVAKDWCLAAPGVQIRSTVAVGSAADMEDGVADGAVKWDGTSMATPHVTGAVAVLMQLFPNLTSQQIVQILLTSATDLGAAGVDAVYGHGLLNMQSATAPIGPLMLKTPAGKVDTASSSVTAGPASGAALARAFKGRTIAVYDDYDRAFLVNLDGFAQVAQSAFKVDVAFDRFASFAERSQIPLSSATTLAFRLRQSGAADAFDAAVARRDESGGSGGIERAKARFSEVTLDHRLGSGTEVTVALNADLNRFVGFTASDPAMADMTIGQAFASPYLGLVQDGYAVGTRARLGTSAGLRILAFSGERTDDFGKARSDGVVSEVTFGSRAARVSLQTGLLDERDRVLGGHGSGAFSLGSSAVTGFVGAQADIRLHENASLLVGYVTGLSRPETEGSSLIRTSGSIRTESFSIGVIGKALARQGDWLSLSLSQPLRVAKGKADVSVPYGYDTAGNPVSADFVASLVPDGRELDIEIAYGFGLGAFTRISTGFLLRLEPDHVRDSPAQGIAMLKLRHAF